MSAGKKTQNTVLCSDVFDILDFSMQRSSLGTLDLCPKCIDKYEKSFDKGPKSELSCTYTEAMWVFSGSQKCISGKF